MTSRPQSNGSRCLPIPKDPNIPGYLPESRLPFLKRRRFLQAIACVVLGAKLPKAQGTPRSARDRAKIYGCFNADSTPKVETWVRWVDLGLSEVVYEYAQTREAILGDCLPFPKQK